MHIRAEDIKKYIVSHRSCNFITGGCVLQPRSGLLSLDFSFLTEPSNCTFTFKRRSGNGKMVIKAGGKGKAYTIKSITAQGIVIPIAGDNKRIDLLRVTDCSGELILCSIDVDSVAAAPSPEPAIAQNKAEATPIAPIATPIATPIAAVKEMDWGIIIKTCGGSKGLKVTNGILYASEGATLDSASKVDSIETEPSNVTKISGDKIKFIYPCQVLSIVLNEAYIPKDCKYINLQRSTPVSVVPGVPAILPKAVTKVEKPKILENIYDSEGSDLFAVANSRVGSEASGTSVLMKRHGSFSIPISGLSSNMSYSMLISARKPNGNGKFSISLFDSNDQEHDRSDLVLISTNDHLRCTLNSGSFYHDGRYALRVHRSPKSSVGDVIIDRIKITHAIPLDIVTPPVPSTYVSNVVKTAERGSISSIINNTNKNTDANIKALFKHYSINSKPIYKNVKIHEDLRCPIQINGFSALQWFNKISPLFPKIENKKGSNISICSINTLIPSNTVWVEEFGQNVTKEQLNPLSYSNVILTPSLTNQYVLSRLFPGKNIKIQHKPWPVLGSRTESSEKYYVYLEKDSYATQVLMDLWKPDFGKLYVVGTRNIIPPHISYISEYESYPELFKIIAGAHCIIDISPNTHYISGILELACSLGLSVITNNHKYIQKTPYIIRNNVANGEYFILKNDIIRAIKRFKQYGGGTNGEQYSIKNVMMKLLEIQ